MEAKLSNLILYSAKRAPRYSRPLAQWLTRRSFVVTTIQRPLSEIQLVVRGIFPFLTVNNCSLD